MTTLLITTLGSAGHDDSQRGHLTARYRLPGGERIVETQHLGLELARALRASKLCFVGTTAAFFDRLTDLLPAESAAAPVSEVDESATQEAVNEPEQAAPADEPAEACSADGAECEDSGADAEDATCADAAPATECSAAATPTACADDAVPADGAAAAVEVAAAPASEVEPSAAPVVLPRKVHVPDTRSLSDRLQAQARTGRPDAGALRALSQRLAAALRLEDVRCVLISDPTSPRATMHALRTLSEMPADGDEVHMDVSFGPRSLPVAAFLAIQFLRRFRPEVRAGSVFMAAPEHADEKGIVPVNTLDGADEMMHWMGLFEALVDGRAPQALHNVFVHDRWLNRLAGPYVRFQRGQRFGALSEVVEGARLVEEKRRGLRRLPSTHPFRLFDPVLRQALRPFVADTAPSSKQFVLAAQALYQGNLPLAALHLRDTLMSACLEAYGRRAAEAWMDVPGSGGAQQVRPRDVAGFVLSTPSVAEQLPPLDIVWPLIAMARNRYVNTSPTTVRAGQLKDEDHEVARAVEMVGALLHSGAFAKLPELMPFELAVQQSIDLRAVRARDGFEGRPNRGPRRGDRRDDRRGPPRGGDRRDGQGDPRGGGHEGNQGGAPRGDAAPQGSAPAGGEGGAATGAGSGAPRQGDNRGNGDSRFRDNRGPRRPREGGFQGGRDGGGPRGPREGGGRPFGDRPPRPEGDRGPRDFGDRPPRRDDNNPADTTPKVTQSHGLGNLGLALAQAGLHARGKDQPPRDETPAPQRTESVAPVTPPQTPTNPEFPVAGP